MARRLLFTTGALCGDDYTVNIDIIGSSQLGGVPTALTDSVSDLRPQRSAGSLDRLTYSAAHVHARQRGRVLVGVVRCVHLYCTV